MGESGNRQKTAKVKKRSVCQGSKSETILIFEWAIRRTVIASIVHGVWCNYHNLNRGLNPVI